MTPQPAITPRAFPGGYRGRLAPSPTGLLHLGHARTFQAAHQRAAENGGVLVLRNDDLDRDRCRPEFVAAMIEDLRWFELDWQEGPDCGGPFAPYNQSERSDFYRKAIDVLFDRGFIYPCTCSRNDVQAAARAPQAGEDEWRYPGTCRARSRAGTGSSRAEFPRPTLSPELHGARVNWRFRVPDNEIISFIDGSFGPQHFVAGKDFGDFVVWRSDGTPAYQLACVVDDAAMKITEVVRGADLLVSTARQLLLYRALGIEPPAFRHCELVTDSKGIRLAKRHDALSLKTLRLSGASPGELRRGWQAPRKA